MLLGSHAVKSWSSTQSSIALSSGEAEFNGVVRGSGIGLGYQSLLHDLGQDLPVRVWTDSSAAMGICSRQGLGGIRHLDTHTLWVQQAVRCRRIDLRKVDGEVNPADIFTKHSISRERLVKLTSLFDCNFRGGRAASAPQMRRTPTSKTTMAEANHLDEPAMDLLPEPIMPHKLGEHDLLTNYPPLEIPNEEGEEYEEEDEILKHGMKIAQEVQQMAEKHGRRRHVRDGGSG